MAVHHSNNKLAIKGLLNPATTQENVNGNDRGSPTSSNGPSSTSGSSYTTQGGSPQNGYHRQHHPHQPQANGGGGGAGSVGMARSGEGGLNSFHPEPSHHQQRQAYYQPSEHHYYNLPPPLVSHPHRSHHPGAHNTYSWSPQHPHGPPPPINPRYDGPPHTGPLSPLSRVDPMSNGHSTNSATAVIRPSSASTQSPTSPPASHFEYAAYQQGERASTRLLGRPHSYADYYQVPEDSISPTSPVNGKRKSADLDDSSSGGPSGSNKQQQQQPKTKKPKTSESTNNGASNAKRGFTGKKRKEKQMKQTAAEPLSTRKVYTHNPSTGVVGKQALERKVRQELQNARCMANKYKEETFPRCVSCTRRWAGDTCRFQGIRFFCRDESNSPVGYTFVPHKDANVEDMKYPTKWNVPLTEEHVQVTKRTAAKALLPTLQKELEHCKSEGIIRRWRESDVRATCDTCMTSLFCCTWMCRKCGREFCADCFARLKEYSRMPPPNATPAEINAIKQKRDKIMQSSPFLFACQKKAEHTMADFNPVSRFNQVELENAIKSMQVLLDAPDSSSLISPTVVIPEPELVREEGHVPYFKIPTYEHDALDENLFRTLWARGQPLQVTNTLSKFKKAWTPEYFIEHYGDQNCVILECQRDENQSTNVRQFFERFGRYENRDGCWKLKDWPPKADYKAVFPELFEDFSNAVPMPNYVRRDGTLNLSSHFPQNTVSPDLGPKMYNAMANTATVDCKGSTRLHMDMSDALNVMTYSANCPDGTPGRAAWDIFKAEDSQKIRQFLWTKFASQGEQRMNDPIHTQQYYLTDAMLKELYDTMGVASFRIYQRPGDAIFIPAGCAHQVCNLSDSIKVAVDFVSPENVNKCEQLTREFREQNAGAGKQWKEDVLQLKTMMWFAWVSCEKWQARQQPISPTTTSPTVAGSANGEGEKLT